MWGIKDGPAQSKLSLPTKPPLPQAYKLSNGEQLSASLIGGTVSALVTIPLDVMVAQIQQASKAVRFPVCRPCVVTYPLPSHAFMRPTVDPPPPTLYQHQQQGQKVSVLSTFKEELKLGGWERVAGFATKGFVARAAHVALTTAIMKNGCTFVYEWLEGN